MKRIYPPFMPLHAQIRGVPFEWKNEKKGGVQWIFQFWAKSAMKLIVEPNFFSKMILILGLYYALESSGLKSQPFSSYKNCCPIWTQ